METRGKGLFAEAVAAAVDRVVWSAVRGAVDAVRYRPNHLKLLQACGVAQPEVPPQVANWVVSLQARPTVVELMGLPHALLRRLSSEAARRFGPTASAIIRFLGGAAAATADSVGAGALERPFRARAHPGLLVPHPHDVAVLAVDMRGFSHLTHALHDTQYLADLLEEYLTALTRVVEEHRGVVFQYTGDGLLAIFLPELCGIPQAQMFDRLVNVMCPALHYAFSALHARWKSEWAAEGRSGVRIGLGVGLSFGRVTLGFIGPSGKKQLGAIGDPVNVAALLCAEADAGSVLVDRRSFAGLGSEPEDAKVIRLRSRKLGRRLEVLCFRPLHGRSTFGWVRQTEPAAAPLPA